MNFLKSFFSVEDSKGKLHKIVTLFGIKIKLRKWNYINKSIKQLEWDKKILQSEKNSLLSNLTNLKYETDNIKVYLLNDTGQYEKEHMGCSLISETIKNLCNKNKMEIIFSDGSIDSVDNDIEKYEPIIKQCDIMIFNGEGTLHDQYPRVVTLMEKCKLAKKMGKKVVLINTVWQNNPDLYKYLSLFDIISTRESFSKNDMLNGVKNLNVRVVPDLTFYSNIQDKNFTTINERYCIFTDSVNQEITLKLKALSEKLNTDFYYLDNHNEPKLNINILKKSTQVITGRFHVLTFCLKLGIPVLAIQSNTHKIEALLKDADLTEFFIESPENMKDKIKEFLNMDYSVFIEKSRQYTLLAQNKIDDLFLDIKKLALEDKCHT